MSITTHPFTPEEVMAFLDGELSADRAQSLSAHLDQCTECHEIVSSLSNASKSLSNWTVPAVPARLENRILDRSHAASNLSEEGFISKLRRFSRLSPALALTAAAFVFVLILIGMSAGRFEKSASAPRREMDYITEQPAAEGQGSLGKLDPLAPSASPVVGDGIRRRGVGASVDFARVDDSKVPPPPPPPPPGPHQELEVRWMPMIAHTVSLSIVAKEFDNARAALDSVLARHNGYASGLNVATPQGAARMLQASLRIPAPQLVAAVAELKALGRVELENQSGEEVTQQHADLVARLKNSRETEQRLQAILLERTGKISDVLEVEQEIARVRGEIEQMEAEQKNLEHRVSFATIDLKLGEEYKAQLTTPAPSVAMQFQNATIDGFRSAFQSLLALVLFLAESGPTLLLWLMILWLPAWLFWRRYRRALALGSPRGV